MTTVPSAPLPGPTPLLELAGIRSDALTFLETMSATHGDVLAYRVASSAAPAEQVVLVNHPEHIARILRTDAHDFTKERTPDHYMLAPLLGNGLLTSNGESWRRQRTAIAPLLRPQEVQRFDQIMATAAQRLADTWCTVAGVRMVDHELAALTLGILVQCIFGTDVAAVGDGFGRSVDAINHHLAHYGRGEATDQDARLSRAAYARGAGLVHAVTDALIASVAGSTRGDAILRRMRDAVGDDTDLHDQVLTLIMAGHETTSKALGWALSLLALHPQLQDAVAAEALAASGSGPRFEAQVANLRLTSAVVRETLRLFPPIWLMSRRSCRDIRLGDHVVPADSLVCISQWLVHRDPRWWEDPLRFRPERFLEVDPGRPTFAYFPFGGGERVCVGQHFAMLELVLTLAMLMRGCRVVAHAEGTARPEALVTLRPEGGVRIEVRPREGADVRPIRYGGRAWG